MLESLSTLQQFVVPDLWQQQAVSALREGSDVVVHAPTGAGKTLIFELWSHQGHPKGQAIYTVPTRALANDKLAEWRARGWNVGIATGDLSDNLDAPIVVATLETQKRRLLQGHGPALLVIDEYQMLGDPDRGLNYELAMALAPQATQLLLLSGSVANPQDIVRWLRRIGRQASLVRTDLRPVPLEEVELNQISVHVPPDIRGYWPRAVAKALAEDLGPILLFAPRRSSAESLAAEIARILPVPHPLSLTPEQRHIAGESLTRMLRTRVAYHHSGLSYAVRAGVIEPLAKAGQLRVVVATMGLAAGINFSLRSVALAGDSYRRDAVEHPLRSDEILQMFGRAGRRGIDETGYVLVTENDVRLREAQPAHLARNGLVDWPALLGIMDAATEAGLEPYRAAVQAQERLFTSKPIFIGVESSLRFPNAACGLNTDFERARHVRQKIRQFLSSTGAWETHHGPQETEAGLLVEVLPAPTERPETNCRCRPALENPEFARIVGEGEPVALAAEHDATRYGVLFPLGSRLSGGEIYLAKRVRRMLPVRSRKLAVTEWDKVSTGLPKALAALGYALVRVEEKDQQLFAVADLSKRPVKGIRDTAGAILWRPPQRELPPPACEACPEKAQCLQIEGGRGVVHIWRRLGLLDARGHPSRRGKIVSFFHQGDGLAIAAALEDEGYPIEELVFDLANLDAGFRFAGDDGRWGGRLAVACRRRFGNQTITGYLEDGLPLKYGAGAEAVVAAVHKDPSSKHAWIREHLGAGDIDRAIIEWRSTLRQVAHAPSLAWTRWELLQAKARELLRETESPTNRELPPLDYAQTKRLEHRLVLRRR